MLQLLDDASKLVIRGRCDDDVVHIHEDIDKITCMLVDEQ